MGAECIISGIRPQIAQTIVHLGVDLGDVVTKATLADAFAVALKRTRHGGRRAPTAEPEGPTVDRIPILKMGEFLLVTIQVDMHDQLALTLQDDLTDRISRTGAKGVLIDIISLEMVDSFIGRMLANIAGMARVLDADDGRGRHAAGRGDHAGRAGPVAARRAHGAQRGAGHGPAARRRQRPDRAGRAMHVQRNESRRDPALERHRAGAPGGAGVVDRGRVQPGGPDQDGHRRERAGPQHARARRRRRGAGRASTGRRAPRRCGSCARTTGRASRTSSWRSRDGYTSRNGLGLGLGGAAGW